MLVLYSREHSVLDKMLATNETISHHGCVSRADSTEYFHQPTERSLNHSLDLESRDMNTLIKGKENITPKDNGSSLWGDFLSQEANAQARVLAGLSPHKQECDDVNLTPKSAVNLYTLSIPSNIVSTDGICKEVSRTEARTERRAYEDFDDLSFDEAKPISKFGLLKDCDSSSSRSLPRLHNNSRSLHTNASSIDGTSSLHNIPSANQSQPFAGVVGQSHSRVGFCNQSHSSTARICQTKSVGHKRNHTATVDQPLLSAVCNDQSKQGIKTTNEKVISKPPKSAKLGHNSPKLSNILVNKESPQVATFSLGSLPAVTDDDLSQSTTADDIQQQIDLECSADNKMSPQLSSVASEGFKSDKHFQPMTVNRNVVHSDLHNVNDSLGDIDLTVNTSHYGIGVESNGVEEPSLSSRRSVADQEKYTSKGKFI